MRSLWNGSISFGLVNIPVKLYAATSHNDIKFNYLHSPCHTPIRYEKVCPTCKREVPQEEIVRGYEFQKGRYVVLEDEDFENIPVKQTKSIDIMDFVGLAEIDPVYFERSYYLEPAEGGLKAYHLLKLAMQETQQIAIAKVVIRSRETLAAVRVYGPGLALETMYFPAEVRDILQLAGIDAEPEVHENELKMAISLISNLTSKFQPEKYENEYRQALLEIIDRKVAGEAVTPAPAPPPAGKVIDLMAALEASVNATRNKKAQTKPPAQAAEENEEEAKAQQPGEAAMAGDSPRYKGPTAHQKGKTAGGAS